MPDSANQHERTAAWWCEHRGLFLKVARAFAPSAADEADLVQEMLVQLWRSLPRFREQCRPSTWIYRVCLNTALTWRRGENRRHARVVSDDGVPETPSPEASPDESHARLDLLVRVYAAVRRLPPMERTLVLLSLDGVSYREISEVTGLTENHVGVALTRARQRLAKDMEEVRNEL